MLIAPMRDAVGEEMPRRRPGSRAATSLLYGSTEDQRREALTSTAPLEVPHVYRSLARPDDVLDRVSTC